jgi:hypothetical protein
MPVVTEHLDQWVREGFLSGDQATAIREYEDHPSPSRPTAVLEVLGYVGAVFVLVAGLLLVVELWTDMSRAAQAALAGSAAAVLIGSGVVIARTEHPRIRRVGAALLLLALVPTGVAVGLVADTWFDEEAAALSGFLAAAILGLLLYVRDRHSVAQHAGFFVASMGTVLFAIVIIEDVAEWVPGFALFLAGVGWLVLASFEIMMPRSVGEVLGAGAALFGSITMVSSLNFEESGAATLVMALAIVVSLLAVGFGVAKDRILVVVGGMLGLIIYLPWLINETLGENVGAPIALLVAGTLLIGSAVYLTRRQRS